MPVPADEWLAHLARQLGITELSEDERDDLLALAGVAAHASERIVAPLSCWLVARAGLETAAARTVVEDLAERLDMS